MHKNIAFVALSAIALTACQDQASSGSAANRSQIQIVGSSTVYPFAKAVAEHFVTLDKSRPSPIIESTGTGAGIELFCKGVGAATPDIANASRRMKKSEFDTCQKNGVTEIVEFAVGLDGLAIGQSKSAKTLSLSITDLYKAVAANPFGKPNNYVNWSDINPAYPKVKINIYGPPTTSGTRDAFEELIMTKACETDPVIKAMKDSDKDKFEAICTDIRTDGAYVDAGENDNLIVQKLDTNPDSVGIFGYSFLEENLDTIKGIPPDSIAPTYDNIASGKYPGARVLYLYLKKAHVGVIPNIKEYLTDFVEASVSGGYLTKIDLIPSSASYHKASVEALSSFPALSGEVLK